MVALFSNLVVYHVQCMYNVDIGNWLQIDIGYSTAEATVSIPSN